MTKLKEMLNIDGFWDGILRKDSNQRYFIEVSGKNLYLTADQIDIIKNNRKELVEESLIYDLQNEISIIDEIRKFENAKRAFFFISKSFMFQNFNLSYYEKFNIFFNREEIFRNACNLYFINKKI